MIKQPIGPLLGEVDCDNVRDFAQYYHRRYFAVSPELTGWPLDKNILLPASYYAGNSPLQLFIYNPITSRAVEHKCSWPDVQRHGKFGHAYLGTMPWKHSYVYLMQSAYRESIKGFGANKVTYWDPQSASKILEKYLIKNPAHLFPFKQRYDYNSEMEGVYHVYNKEMYDWQEALDNLETGQLLGCNISNKMGLFVTEGEPHIQVSYKDRVVGHMRTAGRLSELRLEPEWEFLSQVVREQVPHTVSVM